MTLAKSDTGAAADLDAFDSHAPAGGPAWSGIMHAGGVLADATVANQTLAGVRAVYAPKASAWQQLAGRPMGSGGAPLQVSLLFSSVASLLGSVGQLNYSMANAWLDAAASATAAAGGTLISVQFGAWKGAGMAAATSGKVEAMGLGVLTPSSGLAALHGLLRQHAAAQLPQVAMTPVDWPVFLEGLPTLAPYFGAFAHLKAAMEGIGAASDGTVEPSGQYTAGSMPTGAAAAAAGMSAERRTAFALEEVEAAAAAIMGVAPALSESLMAAGLDSLGAVELRNSLEGRLGMSLPPTLVFDYPTTSAIASFIAASLSEAIHMPAAAEAVQETAPSMESGQLVPVSGNNSWHAPLAIVSMASRSPAGVLEAPLLSDTMTPLPVSRWDAELQLTVDLPARFGGFVSNAFLFDATAFSITSTEALLMDPQQRLLLECTEETLRASSRGVGGPVLANTAAVGVFVGISSPDYADMAKVHSDISAYSATGEHNGPAWQPGTNAEAAWQANTAAYSILLAGSAVSVAAGRISYLYGFRGPSVAVDTACSSSLVGAHMARLSMSVGGCTTASAAGAKLILTPHTSAMFNRAGMLAADGRCKTLDAQADGYVRGEAVVSLLLQLVGGSGATADAVCLLAGSAVNQDGRSSTLTAPNGPAQQSAIRGALASGGCSAAALACVQLHGTGTPLGDPIEVGALAAVLTDSGASRVTLAAGKTGMGHTEPAAGLVGMTHAARALCLGLAQPILHLQQVS